jgi:DNA-directed RNA polymerase beta subunit
MQKEKEPITPKDVTLRDPMDFASLRESIYNETVSAVQKSFPQSYGGIRMEVDKLEYVDPPTYDLAAQKKAILGNKYLGRRLRGEVRLFDEATGNLLDSKSTTLMRVPFLTDRGTYIHNGSEYTSLAQARLIPGIYTRRQKNGNIETQFSVRPGSGNQFRIGFDPASAQYRIKIHSSNLHMYSLLKDIGVPDEQLKEMWGSDILTANQGKYDARVFDKAYERLVPRFLKPTSANREEKAELIKKALDRAMVHETVARRNLPNMFDRAKAVEWTKKAAAQDLVKDVVGAEMDEEDFSPDLGPEEMQDSYDELYGADKPRLASMEHWPAEWIPEGSNPKGWVAWYIDYKNGKRTDDDARQIKRWKSFKKRHGAQFATKPTPRRGYALRNWAIDPLKLIEDEEVRNSAAKAMEDYRHKQELKYHLLKSGFDSMAVKVARQIMEDSGELSFSPADSDSEIFDTILKHLDEHDT